MRLLYHLSSLKHQAAEVLLVGDGVSGGGCSSSISALVVVSRCNLCRKHMHVVMWVNNHVLDLKLQAACRLWAAFDKSKSS